MTTLWESRIVGEGTEAPDQILANPMNWRKHPKHQKDALRGVLKEVGWVASSAFAWMMQDGTAIGLRKVANHRQSGYVDQQ